METLELNTAAKTDEWITITTHEQFLKLRSEGWLIQVFDLKFGIWYTHKPNAPVSVAQVGQLLLDGMRASNKQKVKVWQRCSFITMDNPAIGFLNWNSFEEMKKWKEKHPEHKAFGAIDFFIYDKGVVIV